MFWEPGACPARTPPGGPPPEGPAERFWAEGKNGLLGWVFSFDVFVGLFVVCFIVWFYMPNGSKHWCFTLNNYSEDDVALLRAIGSERNGINYLVFGREIGESGTPHLQGFVSFSNRRTLRYARNLISDRAHFEAAKGSPDQAGEYCKKEGKYEEFGECPRGRGTRNDLASAVAAVKAGASRRVLLEEHATAYSRAYKMLNEALLVYSKSRDWMPVTTVYWGETGTGKTRKAFEDCETVPYMHSGGMWFDGYDGHENVIFDDFGGSEFKLTYLLKLLDRYPMRVPVKGGFVSWIPKNIYITSNYSPKEWFPGAKDEHVKALFRRFFKIMRFRRLQSVMVHNDDSEEYVVGE